MTLFFTQKTFFKKLFFKSPLYVSTRHKLYKPLASPIHRGTIWVRHNIFWKGKTEMYQVKAVKTFYGHDGHGWECKLFRDGKRVALVVEDGYGGGLQFHWDDQSPDIPRVECRNRNYDGNFNTFKGTPEEARLEAYVLDLPQIDGPFEDDDEKMYVSADVFVDDMVTEALYTKDVKKLLKKLAFVKTDGKIYHYKSDNPQTRAVLAKRDPDAVILNDMPLTDAVAKYREVANG